MGIVLKHKVISSAVIALFYSVLIVPFYEAVWFAPNIVDPKEVLYRSVLKLIFFAVLTCLIWFGFTFYERLRARDPFYRRWVKYTAIYGAVLLAVFLLIYPGWWQWDEFYVLNSSEYYQPLTWQHIFTQFYYVIYLYIIPSAIGIMILQAIGCAAVVGYILAKLRERIAGKRFWLMLIPFVFPTTLLYVFMPLRAGAYSFILVLVLFKTFVLLTDRTKRQIANVYATFIGYSFIIALLASWRTEGIIYLLLLPVIAYKLGLIKAVNGPHRAKPIAAFVAAVAICGTFIYVSQATTDPKYAITATYNPLAMILRDSSATIPAKDLALISTALNVDAVRNQAIYYDIPGFWSDGLKPDATSHLKEYNKGVRDIFLHNPVLFAKYRIKTFIATNSFDKDVKVAWPGWLSYFYNGVGDEKYIPQRFLEKNPIAQPFNPDFRTRVLKVFVQQYTNPVSFVGRLIFWNGIPLLLLVLAGSIYALVKRQWTYVLIGFLLLAHAGLIFITAPSSYFMYYFPIYLSSGFMLMYVLVQSIDTRKSKGAVERLRR